MTKLIGPVLFFFSIPVLNYLFAHQVYLNHTIGPTGNVYEILEANQTEPNLRVFLRAQIIESPIIPWLLSKKEVKPAGVVNIILGPMPRNDNFGGEPSDDYTGVSFVFESGMITYSDGETRAIESIDLATEYTTKYTGTLFRQIAEVPYFVSIFPVIEIELRGHIPRGDSAEEFYLRAGFAATAVEQNYASLNRFKYDY